VTSSVLETCRENPAESNDRNKDRPTASATGGDDGMAKMLNDT